MNSDIIEPFIKSAVHVIKIMANTETTPGAISVRAPGSAPGAVSGIIGMAGENVDGMMVISFDEPCVLSIVSKMLSETFTELNNDVIDAVGEITNMICGGSKKELGELGYAINMSTPIMITGGDVHLAQFSKSEVVSIPFTTEKGQFTIEARIEKK